MLTHTKSALRTKSDVYKGTDHTYVNLQIYNGTNSLQNAVFSQSYTDAIVTNPMDYYLSVVRFNIPATNIPIFFFLDNEYSVTLQTVDGLQTSQIFLTYIANSPGIPFPGQQPVYSYQTFVDSLNNAFAAAFAAVVALGAINATSPPYVTFNAETQLCSVNVPFLGYRANLQTTAPPVATNGPKDLRIFMNYPLHSFFESLQVIDRGSLQPNGTDVEIIVEDTGDNILITAPSAVNGIHYSNARMPSVGGYYTMEQEWNSLFLWNDFSNIIIQSVGIPIRNELLPNIDGQLNTFPICTDFSANITSGTDARQAIQYSPQGEYRMIDLMSNVPLTTFQLNLYWSDHSSNLYPILLSPNEYVNIKLMFRRKGVPYNVYREVEFGGQNEPDLIQKVSIVDDLTNPDLHPQDGQQGTGGAMHSKHASKQSKHSR